MSRRFEGAWFLNHSPAFLKKLLTLAKSYTLQTDIYGFIENTGNVAVASARYNKRKRYAPDANLYAELKIFMVQYFINFSVYGLYRFIAGRKLFRVLNLLDRKSGV